MFHIVVHQYLSCSITAAALTNLASTTTFAT